jgi:predicted transcriptional regulator
MSARTVSVTLPPELLDQVEAIARRENRAVDDLIRDALEQYERKQWWEQLNSYGRARAQELGLTEEDVVPAVNAVRAERAKNRSRQ